MKLRRRFAAAALLAGCVLPGATACESDGESAQPLTELAPTRAQVAKEAGIYFPKSTEQFRLARMSGSDLNVSWTMASTDTDSFAKKSGFTLATANRVITHSSPLWELNVEGALSGATSTFQSVQRAVEVVANGEQSTVRLVLHTATSSD